jgi:hypothetical protein
MVTDYLKSGVEQLLQEVGQGPGIMEPRVEVRWNSIMTGGLDQDLGGGGCGIRSQAIGRGKQGLLNSPHHQVILPGAGASPFPRLHLFMDLQK